MVFLFFFSFTPPINKVDFAKTFMGIVTKNGGQWIADNVNYDPRKSYSFPQFMVEFIRLDSLSLWAKISGISQRQDTVKLWEIWEFIDIHAGITKITQRSPVGHYGFGEAIFESSLKRNGKLELNFTNGASTSHKSVHEFLEDNVMVSITENYDLKAKKWIKSPAQKWRRVVQ